MSIFNANQKRGFIALLSMIILGFMLLLTVITLGNRSIGGRFILLDLERKEMSAELASVCVHVAVISLVNDPAYTVVSPVEIPVGDNNCKIVSITPDDGLRIIQAQGVVPEVGGATTNIEAVWDTGAEEIDFWQEVAAF